jgi:type II secretory pathway pseudopilin PulG
MTRKSQLNHVFTYLMIIMVIGVLVVIAVSAWKSIIAAQCANQEILFQKDLIDMIDEYSDQGTVKQESIRASCGAKEVCFVDSMYYAADSPYSVSDIFPVEYDTEEYLVIKSAVNDKTQNIFVKTDFIEPIGFAPKLVLKEADQPLKCFPVKNQRLKLVFTGLGRKTQVDVQ